MHPRTPIRIKNGKVLAWIWNGRERTNLSKIPIYRLKKPRIGHSKNGRLLSFPSHSQAVQVLD